MGRGSGSGDGSGGGKGSGKVAAPAAAAVEWLLVNTTINRQKPNTWMADGSSKQNRLTFFPLPAVAGHESRRKEEEPGLRNVCLGEVFEWRVLLF